VSRRCSQWHETSSSFTRPVHTILTAACVMSRLWNVCYIHRCSRLRCRSALRCFHWTRKHVTRACCVRKIKLECGPMPNVMAALPNIGDTFCESSVIPFLVPCCKVWITLTAGVPCSNAANIGERKTWPQSEFCTWQNSARGQEPPKVYI